MLGDGNDIEQMMLDIKEEVPDFQLISSSIEVNNDLIENKIEPLR